MSKETYRPYRCPACQGLDLGASAQGAYLCPSCGSTYEARFGIIDFIPNPSAAVVHELHGIAAENGIALGKDLSPVKFLPANSIETIGVLMDRSRRERTQYYQQTTAAFFEGLARAKVDAGLRVLEIGSERWHFKLRTIRDLCDEAYALNIFFHVSADNVATNWPVRLLGDMNDLPFASGSLDLILCSATLHHTGTLERALGEIARVLRRGGRAIVVNEPVEGTMKTIGLREGVTRHDRHEDIHEEPVAYRQWIQAIKASGLRPDLFIPAWFTEQVASATSLPENVRFGGVARKLAPVFRSFLLQDLARTIGRVPGQALLGLPLNAVLWKL